MTNTKKRIKDYNKQKKKLNNPFVKKRKKPRINWKRLGQSLLIIAAIAGVGWWLFFSGFWNIDDIKVKGESRISSEDIREVARKQLQKDNFVFSPRNLIFFDKKKLIGELRDKYHFPGVTIDKKIPNKLIVNIEKNHCDYILRQDGKYYKIDKEGHVIDSSDDLGNKDVPLIKNIGDSDKIGGGISYVKEDYVSYINDLYSVLARNSSDVKIEYFALDDRVSEMEKVKKNSIKMQVAGGPAVYLDRETEAENHIQKLLLLKERKLKQDFWKKEYIILKYGDRIFYK